MQMRTMAAASFGLIAAFVAAQAAAQDAVTIPIHLITDKGVGAQIGEIKAFNTTNGFLGLTFNLAVSIPPGGHGMHIHEAPSCEPAERDGAMVAGLAAGGHYDPAGTGKHLGPSGEGHLGDLPILFAPVAEMGTERIQHTLVAPRLKLEDIRGRSIVIHAGSDNFRDEPKPLGGGGARVACGVIP